MSDIFSRALDDVDQLQEDLLGPEYNYTKQIKSPEEMGMSSQGSSSAISNNISGLISYTQLLVTGSGNASKTGGPLGDKFFLETGAKCKDKETGEEVSRSIYVNNVPDGSIPFITRSWRRKVYCVSWACSGNHEQSQSSESVTNVSGVYGWNQSSMSRSDDANNRQQQPDTKRNAIRNRHRYQRTRSVYVYCTKKSGHRSHM